MSQQSSATVYYVPKLTQLRERGSLFGNNKKLHLRRFIPKLGAIDEHHPLVQDSMQDHLLSNAECEESQYPSKKSNHQLRKSN